MTKVLKGAGVDRMAVVKCNVYLTNLPRDFVPMNEVYREVGSLYEHTRADDSSKVNSTSPSILRPAPALVSLRFPSVPIWRSSALRSCLES